MYVNFELFVLFSYTVSYTDRILESSLGEGKKNEDETNLVSEIEDLSM